MFVAIILSLMGLFLIYLEFFLPGSIFAIGGSVLLLTSLFFLVVEKVKIFHFIVYALILVLLVLMVIKLALKKLKANKDIFLNSDQEGYRASNFKKDLIGKDGIASTDLRPAGKIFINEKSYFAITRENYIEKGKKIKVIAGHGSNLIVKELKKR
ncbi:MAG: hypothetical protein KR126chlam4_01121 [Candidatus Anoxychlamydiales bacterium]|nr:hypothetical protein [Candidatus Anoxychlamydiales bacterium]NGX41282.1 hypothetical protein [Candidatus Anoxychlamydiales bacterium]HEU64963.1 hypothetical protein [Chlamydiota bacterium]